MNPLNVQALVNFYAQKGYFRHVQNVCKDVLKKRPTDHILQFWLAFGLSQEGILL